MQEASMQRVRNSFVGFVGQISVTLLVAILMITTAQAPSLAQDAGAVCPVLVNEIPAAVAEACSSIAAGQACYGAGQVSAAGEASLAAVGETADLAALSSLSTAADAPAESWGVAVLNALLDLPAEAASGVSLILYGDATLDNTVEGTAEAAPTITLQNNAGYPVNLRSGAGTTFTVAGTLEDGIPVTADGRNGNGDWYRILTDSGPAWVYQDLVTIVDGEPDSLNTLADDNVLLGYTQPWQAVTLTTSSDALCGAGADGLLIHLTGEDTVHMQINGVDLAFSTVTLLVQTPSDAEIQFLVLEGDVNAAFNAVTESATTGERIAIEYASDTGPSVHQAYSYAMLNGAPLDLLPTEMACMTGLLPDDGTVTLSTAPGEDGAELTELDADLHYPVTGQHTTDDGVDWWQLDIVGLGHGWVPQSDVTTLGQCGAVETVAAPVMSSPLTAGAASGFVPAGQSIWMTDPGLDNTSGTCNGPAVALCAHLAAITPNPDGTLTWRGQEPVPYTLSPAGENTYVYNGRNALGNGNIQLNLTFTSEGSWSMTSTTIYDNDPACQHTFYYTASRSW
jgi:hypothetical protein